MVPGIAAGASQRNSETIIIIPPRAEGPGEARGADAEGVRATIRHLWFARKAALDALDSVEAQARVEELDLYMRREGITSDPSIARGFAYEGYESLNEGNYERARESFELAKRFDPVLAEAQFGYAWSLLKAGRGLFAFLDGYARGLRLSWSGFAADQILISNLLVITAAAGIGFMILVALFIVLRCQSRFRHDIEEVLAPRLGARWSRFAGWVVFLLPICLWIGGLWLLMFWLIVTFAYMRRFEKILTAGVFLTIALAPLTTTFVLDRFESATDPDTRAVLTAVREGYSPTTVESLQRILGRHADATELRLLLGLLYAKADRQAEAYEAFQAVIDMDPSRISAMVNLGNVYYRLGEFSQAVQRYKQALEMQPELISGWWNLYLAQTELLHFAEAEASLARAREIDKGRVGDLLGRKKNLGSGEPVFESATVRRLRAELGGRRGVTAGLGDHLLNPMSLGSIAGLLLSLAMAFGLRDPAVACRRCARAFCTRCTTDSSGQGYCSRCSHLILRRDQITQDVRLDEMSRLHRRDRIRSMTRRMTSLVFPGSGLILADRASIGTPILAGWILVGFHLLLYNRLLLAPRVPVLNLPDPLFVLACLAMIFFWVCGNMLLVRAPLETGGTHGA